MLVRYCDKVGCGKEIKSVGGEEYLVQVTCFEDKYGERVTRPAFQSMELCVHCMLNLKHYLRTEQKENHAEDQR